MVNKKEISDVLSLYETEQYSKEAKDNLKAQVSTISIRHVPEFSLTGFLSGVIKGLTPWFFILSLIYLTVVFAINLNAQSTIYPLVSCILTPFLAVGSLGCIYFSRCISTLNPLFASKSTRTNTSVEVLIQLEYCA